MSAENFRTKFIVNPASANGSTGRLWDKLRNVISGEIGEVDASFTEDSNHATELTRNALSDGFEMVVAVGGDGTVNEVVNGFFASGAPVKPDAVLGVISRGTGSDFIKAMNIPKELEAAARARQNDQTLAQLRRLVPELQHDGDATPDADREAVKR